MRVCKGENVYTIYMETNPVCPTCHTQVRFSDYFCFNCGKNLHEKPPSITVMDQTLLYAGSIFLPPMGFIWGWKYIKQPDQKTRIVGIVAIAITVVVLLWAASYTVNIYNTVTKQVDTQLNGIGGL